MAATPIDDKCNMKIMRKHVVNKLSPYWSVVCQRLGYSTTGLVQDNKKNLIAVLEHWINSGEKEGRPRMWSMFIGVLSNISELSSVTSDICTDLNTAGVYIIPSSSRSHDPSPRQSHFPLLVQDDTSSITAVADGKVSQSAPRMAATPIDDKCNMKIMRKHVVNKLSPYWSLVCQCLGYSTAGLGQDDKKNLIAVLEHWINSGEKEGRPRMWSMFIGVLSNISELSTVTSDICADLNTAGVYTPPPSSRPHDPSPRQPEAPLLVLDNTSSLTDVADGPNKPTGQPTPPNKKPLDMKIMYKHVVSKLSSDWTSVGNYLEYSVAERNNFKGPNNNKRLAALLENWISTSNGRKPKTWSTFFEVLNELDEDLSLSVCREICASIQAELAAPSTPVQQKPSARPASDSVPPPQHPQDQQFKHSLSFPADSHPNKAPYKNRQQSDDDIRRKLDYDMNQMSIAEDNTDWPSQQPKHGQSHGTAYQPSLGQKSTANPIYTIGPSPSPPPTANVRPSVAVGTPPPTSMMAGQQNIHRPFNPSPSQWCHPLHGYPSIPPGRPIVPTQAYPSMYNPQGPPSMSPSHMYQSLNFPRGHPSAGPQSLQHPMYRGIHPGSQFQRPPREFHPSRQGGQNQQIHSGDPRLSLRQPRPQHDPQLQRQMHSMHPQVDQHRYDFQGQQQTQGPQGYQPHQILRHEQRYDAQGPYQMQGSPPTQGPHPTQGPPHSTQGPRSMQRPPYRQGQPPGQAMEQYQNLQTQQGRQYDQHNQHLLQSHGQAMEQQSQQGQLAAQELHPQQSFPSSQHTTEQQLDKQSMQQMSNQDQQPQGVTSRSHDNTDYHNTIYGTRSSTSATNGNIVNNVTGASSVTNMNTAAMSPTSSSSGTTSPTKTTGRWPVCFSQSPTTTQPNVQSTARMSSVTSSVATAITVSSPTSENTVIANNQPSTTSSKRPVNSSNIQINSNGVEQVTSMNQSTVHDATSSGAAADVPKVAAPFKWKKGKRLGRGAFGEVFLCKDEDNDRHLAVKEVWIDPNFSNDTRQAVESLEKEIKLLQNMRHDRIVQYYGTERTKTSVRIFMEYMPGGSLYHYIDQFGVLKEQTASKYTRQLLEGVDYLHLQKIVHRDIKGANILMDLSGHVKLADFGASKLLRSIYLSSRSHKKNNNQKSSVTGTAYWMAPEVIRGETVNHKADIWSIGCTVVEMLTSHPPYHHLEPFPAMYRIAIEPMSVDLPQECSDHAHDFLYQCFASKISERPAASVLLEHQFVKIDVHSSCSTVQGTTVTTTSLEVTTCSQTVTQATNGSNNVPGPVAVSSDQSSSASNDDDDTPDDDHTNDNYAMAGEDIELLKQPSAKSALSSMQTEQPQASMNVHSTEPQSETNAKTLFIPTTATSTTAEKDSTGRITPTNLHLKQVPESSATNASTTTSSGSASNINDNSTSSKMMPEKSFEPSNTCMKDLPLWKDKQQMETASGAFVSNLFGNFPATTAGGTTVVQVFVMNDNNISVISPTGPVSLPIIDHREITHNSLEPFANDIFCSVDVVTILPMLLTCGLLTRSDSEYFISSAHTTVEKQQRLTCLAISLNEECVEKFLKCLSQTAVEYAPHSSLLEKIQKERKKPLPSGSNQ